MGRTLPGHRGVSKTHRFTVPEGDINQCFIGISPEGVRLYHVTMQDDSRNPATEACYEHSRRLVITPLNERPRRVGHVIPFSERINFLVFFGFHCSRERHQCAGITDRKAGPRRQWGCSRSINVDRTQSHEPRYFPPCSAFLH